MELKVGMYIRSPKGKIEKITSLVIQDNPIFPYTINCTARFRADITKASFNIIDLIEVGDYVNGEFVIQVSKEHGWVFTELTYYNERKCEECHNCFIEEEIKSIVTKEAFERESYKVGD